MESELMKIPLSKARELERRIGIRVWDGLLFNRDGITNPMLTVLPNAAGSAIRQLVPHCRPDKNCCTCKLAEPSENDPMFCATCGCPMVAHSL